MLLSLVALLSQSQSSQAQAPEAAPGFSARLAAPVRIEADGKPIDTGAEIAHSGPLYADITGDGLPELLVGTFSGLILVHSNTGTRAQPVWTSKGPLQHAEGARVRIHNW